MRFFSRAGCIFYQILLDDMAEELVSEIDGIRDTIGVDRGALIKVWLYERVKQEKALTARS